MWRDWDWSGRIKPQLDDIAKIGNAVRFWGNTLPVADSSISVRTYLERWRQALDYSSSIGLFVYPCGGDLRHWGDLPAGAAADIYSRWAALLTNYPKVVGVDITNEASDSLAGAPTRYAYRQPERPDKLLSELTAIVRASGIPVTHSRAIRHNGGWTSSYFTDYMSDFLDFHVYYPARIEESSAAYEQPWGIGKKLIVGEFGKDTTTTPSARHDYYTALRKLCTLDERCVGAFAWSAWDLGSDRTAQWGLFDSRRVLRSDIGNVFLSLPTTS